jgi:hypothetical protein
VAAAARLTAAHHSGQRHGREWRAAAAAAAACAVPMPNGAVGGKGAKGGAASRSGKGAHGDRQSGAGSGPRPGDWPCTICGTPGNRAWRTRCRGCDAYRNRSMAKAMEVANRPKPSLAEKQVQQQQAAQKSQRRDEAERKRLRDANAKLAAEVAALKAQHAQQAEGDDEDEEMEEDGDDESFEAWTEESRAKRVELAKGGLAYAIEKYGENSTEASELRNEIAKIQRASRQAKPFKAHRAQLERRRDRLQRQQERDECELDKVKSEITELQTKMDTLRAAVAERTKTIKEVTAELTELVRKSIAEGEEEVGGDAPSGPKDESPWGKVSSAIKVLETLPGIPPELTSLLARVQEAAVAMATAANQANQQGAAGGSTQPAYGQPAASTPPAPSANPSEAPAVLAPHGRFGKPRTGPLQAQRADSTDDGGRRDDKGGDGTTTTSGAEPAERGGATAKDAAGNAGGERTEGAREGDDPMHVELETSLAKLPEADQRRLREALDRNRGRSRVAERGDTGEGSTRREERERSPRPVKGGEDKEL